MPKFPEPPPVEVLARTQPDERVLPSGFELVRLYFRGGVHPTAWNAFRRFGPVATARFDHHLPLPREQERAILYAAVQAATCLAEAFQNTCVIDRHHAQPWLAGLVCAAPLTLLDLTGAWPTLAGASQVIASGPRPRAQRWSRAIYAAYPHLDGLWYGSSMHANQPAVALYERAGDRLAPVPLYHRALADPLLALEIQTVAALVGYRLV